MENENVDQVPEPQEKPIEKNKPPIFTKDQQEIFDKLIKREKQKLEEKNREIAGKLTELQTNYQLTHEQNEQLAAQISSLQSTYETEADARDREYKKQIEKFKQDLDKTAFECNNWKDTFIQTKIKTEILGACTQDVISSEVIYDFLSHKSKVVEVVDPTTGKKIPGQYTVKLKWIEKAEDGISKELDLTPTQYIQKMKDNPSVYGGFFKSTKEGGLGASNANYSNGGIQVTEAGIDKLLSNLKLIKHRG